MSVIEFFISYGDWWVLTGIILTIVSLIKRPFSKKEAEYHPAVIFLGLVILVLMGPITAYFVFKL